LYDNVDPTGEPRRLLRLVPRPEERCPVCQGPVESMEMETPAHFAELYEKRAASEKKT